MGFALVVGFAGYGVKGYIRRTLTPQARVHAFAVLSPPPLAVHPNLKRF